MAKQSSLGFARKLTREIPVSVLQQTLDVLTDPEPFPWTVQGFGEDADHAFVYIPDGCEWVSAEPRPATVREVRSAMDKFKHPARYRDFSLDTIRHHLKPYLKED